MSRHSGSLEVRMHHTNDVCNIYPSLGGFEGSRARIYNSNFQRELNGIWTSDLEENDWGGRK